MGLRLSADGRNMTEVDGFLNIPVSDEVAFRASFKSSLADSFINQTVDRYDWSLDYNRDGKIGQNVSGPGGPDLQVQKHFDQFYRLCCSQETNRIYQLFD